MLRDFRGKIVLISAGLPVEDCTIIQGDKEITWHTDGRVTSKHTPTMREVFDAYVAENNRKILENSE